MYHIIIYTAIQFLFVGPDSVLLALVACQLSHFAKCIENLYFLGHHLSAKGLQVVIYERACISNLTISDIEVATSNLPYACLK